MAEEETTPHTQGSNSRGLLTFIMIFQLVMLGAVGFLFTRIGAPVEAAAMEEPGSFEEEEPKPAKFLALDPPFVVNLAGSKRASFLQVAVEVMSRDEEVITALEANLPVVRNNLLMLFSDLDAQVILTREGKQALRDRALAEIQAVLEGAGAPTEVEDVYFTSFVVQ